MALSASKLRANIYQVLDEVLETGKPVEIDRKGRILRIVPPPPPKNRFKDLPKRKYVVRGKLEDLIHMDWSKEWKPFL